MADSEITLENLPKLKVAELKKACKDQGLPVSGTKAELLTRLQESLQLQVTEEDGVDEGDDSEQDINLEDTLEAEASIEEDSKDNISTEPPIKKIVLDKDDSGEPKSTEAKIVISKGLTDEERLQKRAAKFGVQSEDAKKKSRAERFGIVDKSSSGGGNKIVSTPVAAEDLDKLKQRAERFGAVVSNQLSKLDEEEKIAKRKERFGAVLSPTTNKNNKISDINSTLSPAEQEKKRKRAERFGLTT
ncbi:hypothetical protein LOTGIDRAFT_239238 [Lottia gigantea]|uniref:SAP domain-containing protein n=1 Tax=Lottia gigantea TaxID=225164 RepID=V4ASK9_LOTGI|nr:hypothetical protein LOTGIDRAFT_239238 [Lottia gigantea]ESO96726.1 hypothetical protein LOTGIDRAFT_239238 [Lottia gigantea]